MNIRQKLLVALIKWLSRFAPAKSEAPAEQPKEEGKKQVSILALMKAGAETEGFTPVWELPKLPVGVVPAGVSMAMDGYAEAAAAYFAQFDTTGFMRFPGYPALAEKAQYSEFRSPTVTLATEMTRKWISFKSTGEEDRTEQLREIEAAFDQFKVRDTIRLAIENDGLFGRGMIYVDTGNPALDDVPLIINSATIKKDGLKGFKSIEPIWTSPAQYNAIDPTAKDFYKPSAWYVMGKQIHNSRVMIMISHPLPDMFKPAYNFSGLSMTQLMTPAVEQWWRTRAAVSDLVHSYSTSGVKTDLSAVLAGGNGDDLINRAKLFNQLRDNRGLMLLDNENEEFFQFNTPLSGLDALQAQAQEQMAAPCHIPLVKLFGITPNGLNASSEGEIKVFYDYIQAMQQTLLTDPLVKILQIIQLHLFGEIYDDITFEYCPLEQMTDEQIANINKTKADTDVALVTGGILSAEESRKRLASDPLSGHDGLDAEEMPDEVLDNEASTEEA